MGCTNSKAANESEPNPGSPTKCTQNLVPTIGQTTHDSFDQDKIQAEIHCTVPAVPNPKPKPQRYRANSFTFGENSESDEENSPQKLRGLKILHNISSPGLNQSDIASTSLLFCKIFFFMVYC